MRVLTLCLSLALAVLGLAGVVVHASTWLVVLAFVGAAVGVGLDAMLWATQGRASIIVAFGMAAGLVVLSFAGVIANASPWLCWSMFALAMLFLAMGVARRFSPSMYAGELR